MKTPLYTGIFQSDLDATGYKLVNLPTPTASSDAATKGYVDAHAGGGGGGGTNPLITVNVKDSPYNAAGDGTTDDTAAIQNAINAVFALGGGTIFFPKGTYLCNGAFDATANSILTIPYKAVGTGGWSRPQVPIAFLGEMQPMDGNSPVITSTKTGTGTVPALLSAGPSYGGIILDNSKVNFVDVYINKIEFHLPNNPTIGALRLEIACWASLEDVLVSAGDANSNPTHGTIGIWMPGTGNGGISYANRVVVYGFDTAFRVGEHFRAPFIFAFRCKTGIAFDGANETSWVNLTTYQLNYDVMFSGYHPVQMLLDTEHAQAGTGWMDPVTAIYDPSNYGRGEIKYAIVTSNIGPVSGPITMSGGSYLSLTDYRTGITTFAPSGSVTVPQLYVGTDARLTSISGGVKLEVRNAGTGVWVEATRYTNP